jgi:hypothetical protein
MRRLALLQYHGDFDVAASRVRNLRASNPGVLVCGLFGGGPADAAAADAVFGGDRELVYHLASRDPRWKWQNTDLAVREWYRDVGRGLSFDVLHVVQWDLLLLDSLDRLYAHVPEGALALTAPTPIASIADRWHWTLVEPHRSELPALAAHVEECYGASAPDGACLGPGYALPREFLERYASADVPELCHDEIRLPLFARIFGFPVADTGFYPTWFDPEGERFFNANGDEIEEAVIRNELRRPGGRRVFHPFRRAFEPEGS